LSAGDRTLQQDAAAQITVSCASFVDAPALDNGNFGLPVEGCAGINAQLDYPSGDTAKFNLWCAISLSGRTVRPLSNSTKFIPNTSLQMFSK
jgi:hypothetical protein